LRRQLAYLGLLDDAAPLFREGSAVPGAGVLLALPCLVESGLFRIGDQKVRLTRLAARATAPPRTVAAIAVAIRSLRIRMVSKSPIFREARRCAANSAVTQVTRRGGPTLGRSCSWALARA
jgi:hypothetical protein